LLDTSSPVALYRQLAESIESAIRTGALVRGARLPATRELAGQLGLNRTTVSAAYSVLEASGLVQGQVGRGSFVAGGNLQANQPSIDWERVLPPAEPLHVPQTPIAINFASARPSEHSFPLADFRAIAREVIDSEEASEILQLGSPYGYAPLRKYLLSESLASGNAQTADDLIITNGCQQALDLLARVFVTANMSVVLEDPVYHGLLRVFSRSGANLVSLPIGVHGLNTGVLETLLVQQRPQLLLVTPDFQNPTGITLSLEQRQAILAITQRLGVIVIESQLYRDLRYVGQSLPSLKQMDEAGNVIAIGSYSKVAFPGLRVGWVIAPRPVVQRLAEAKQTSDLHSDQLSQAVLLRFAQKGALLGHLKKTCLEGREKLQAALDSCSEYLPNGTRFTRPDGGMNLWAELPAPLLAEDLLKASESRGVTFLTGAGFSARRTERRALRISFGGLPPEEIREGIAILGEIARAQMATQLQSPTLDAAVALV
jgi:2-aminoadipate transaminase